MHMILNRSERIFDWFVICRTPSSGCKNIAFNKLKTKSVFHQGISD